MVKALPNTSFLPVPKSAPAGHTTAAAHLLWQVFPRYPCLEYKDNPGHSCPVRYTWTASFGCGLMFWQKWFNLTPQFVAYQLPGHLLHPHWYFTAYSSICQVLLGALKADACISSKDLYAIYKMWCEENNLVTLKARSFSDNLIANLKKYNLEHTNNIANSAGRRVWGYLGIEALVRPEPAPLSWSR